MATTSQTEKAEAAAAIEPGTGVYHAIAAIQGKLSKDGISKDRKNKEQGYSFRGIDDVYNALAPLLSENKLCILPRVLHRDFRERVSAKGTALFYVVVDVEFDFICATDGTKHTIKTMGEAMDTADKATNKAMSAAYKYACLQAFCIPTEGDNDADGVTHEVKGKSAFDSPELRNVYAENSIVNFERSQSVESLNELVMLAKPRLEEMRATGHPEDGAAVDRINAAYREKLLALKAIAKPKTVESTLGGANVA